MSTKRTALLVATLLVLALMSAATEVSAQPKNVLVFIGDGMGKAEVDAARMYRGAPLSFEAFPSQGWITTYSANSSITDSAAAATAMATGVKVNNGVISMAYPGDGHELETLVEYYRDRSKRTGLVTTTYVTHATPAAFGAHEPSRNNFSNIAQDYLHQTLPNVLLGGGANGMTTGEAAAAGYTMVTDRVTMQALNVPTTAYVSGQFGTTYMPYEYDGVGALPHLSEMTSEALAILEQDPDGFFLMVEGGNIDPAAHGNDIARAVFETMEFDNSVRRAINWAAGRTDTLILVTADHETGGLVVLQNNGPGNFPAVSWLTTGHTGANVPVYAWGYGSGLVSGVMDNTYLFDVATIPEPASFLLLVSGAGMMFAGARKRWASGRLRAGRRR